MSDTQLSYEEALAELNRILENLDNDTTDIDNLLKEVKRASFLIELCKKKLLETDKEVNKFIKEYNS